MNLGIYSPSYPGFGPEGGVGSYTRDLARELAALGHRVHVLTPGAFPGGSSDGWATVHPTRTDYFRGVEKILPGSGACYRVGVAMKRLVRRHALNLVEFSNWEGLGLWYGAHRPTPLVVRVSTSSTITNEIDGVRRSRTSTWDARRERWLCRIADQLITHSRAHRRTTAEELGIDPARIAVVPLAVATNPAFRRVEHAFATLNVVYLGRMEKRKGTVNLIQAAATILDMVPNAQFTFIGADRPHCPGGRTHAEFIAQEIPSSARSRIRLTGRLPDAEVDQLLQSADLFVAPSLYESFGLIFLEAMRWGVPVVGTTVGGIPEIVEHGRTGFLVPPDDPASLTATIVAALRDRELRQRVGEAGRRHVESEFTLARMAQRNEEIYRTVLAGWSRAAWAPSAGGKGAPAGASSHGRD